MQRLATSSGAGSRRALLSLQGATGNRAVQRLLDDASLVEDEQVSPESPDLFNVPSAQLPAPGGGQPIPDQVRRGMEGALGQDFSNVRVHTDSSPDDVGALAYTQGADVHFRPGMYQPDSQSGREALGHELAHVVQQRAGRVATPQGLGAPVNADPSLEAEADVVGRQAARAIESGAALAEPATAPGGAVEGPAQRIAAPVQRERRGSVAALEERRLVSSQRGMFEPSAQGGGSAGPGVEVEDIAASLPSSVSDALTAAPEATSTPAPSSEASGGESESASTETDESGLPEGSDALATIGKDLPAMAADAADLQAAVGSGDAIEAITEGGEAESEADASGLTSVPTSASGIASALGLPPPSTVLPQIAEAQASEPTLADDPDAWWNTELDAMGGSGRSARGAIDNGGSQPTRTGFLDQALAMDSRGTATPSPAPAPGSTTSRTVTGSVGADGYEQPFSLPSAPVVPATPTPSTATTMNTGTASGSVERPVSAASVAPPGYVPPLPGRREGYRENPFEAEGPIRAPIASRTMNTGTPSGSIEQPVRAESVAPGPVEAPWRATPTASSTATSMSPASGGGVQQPVTVPAPMTSLRAMGRQGASRNVRGTAEGNSLDDAALYTGVTGAVGSATGAASTTSQSLFGGSLAAAGQVANVAGGTSILGGISSLAEAGSAAGAAHVASGTAQAEEALRATGAVAAAGSSASNAAVGVESARLTAQGGGLVSAGSGATNLIQAAGTAAAGFSIAAGSAQVLGGVTQAVASVGRYNNLTEMASQRGGTASGNAASAVAETQRQRAIDGGVTATRGAASVAGGAILIALGLTNPIGLGLLAGAAIAGGAYALYKWWRGKKTNKALKSTKPEKQAKQDLAVLLFQEGIVSKDTEYVAILIELGFNADKVMQGPAGGITAGKILSKIS